MAGLLNFDQFLRSAEGYSGDYYTDPSKTVRQKNIGHGVRATKEVRGILDAFADMGLPKEQAHEFVYQKAKMDHAERAKNKFNKGVYDWETGSPEIPFEKQPKIIQELLTELEYSTKGGVSGWPTLMKHAKSGNYEGVEKEMYLNEKGKGAPRRNRLRREYFAKDIKALPELRVVDAYGTVEPAQDASLWPDATMFGLPKHPIDYLFGSKEPSPQQQYEAARMNRPPLAPPQMAVPDKSMMYPPPKPQMAPIDKSMMYPEPKRSLQQQAQTAQVQPALNPFPWLKGTSGGYYGSGNPRNF